MKLAVLLTLLATFGAWAGVFLGRRTTAISEHLAAAGGGLLFGIALFWLVPEVGETAGLLQAFILALSIAAMLSLLDSALAYAGHSVRQGVLWPLLLATSVHSALDGWSVRMLSVHPFTNLAVTAGLALHKIPEGAAVGWISRRTLESSTRAMAVSMAVEMFTVAGALAEPVLNASGAAHFGAAWNVGVLSVIAGGFLFLGIHMLLPAWKRRDVVATFVGTWLLVGALTLF